MKAQTVLTVLLVVASAIQAQQSNTRTPDQQHAEMMKRGDMGMGFSHEKTTHHFFMLKDGGVIQVSANDPKDDASRDHIRRHLSHVARMFSEGNFNTPMFIHDTTPPGVPTMEKLHAEIHYQYQQTDAGAKILINTANLKAVRAVHEFLRFQISEHQTGDPMEPTHDANDKHE
ncbi:MAG TPA: hypothetical protein VIX37_18765 [Candidatus Sulfotelmatobacter sp.]